MLFFTELSLINVYQVRKLNHLQMFFN